jgi:hypothetical protein
MGPVVEEGEVMDNGQLCSSCKKSLAAEEIGRGKQL